MTEQLIAPFAPTTYECKSNKVIYINSARHGYSEIPVNENLAMFGGNNVGKTASLAGMKLILFPYTSFTNQYSKFKLEGAEGRYTDLKAFQFYFPSQNSYIILEGQNKDGVFCMVLFKGAKTLEYGRYFVPASYDEIRNIFWSMDEDELDGDYAEDLSLKTVDAKLKKLGAIRANDKGEIARMLYAGHKGTKAESRFCLIPLQDTSKDSIEAFKNIYLSCYGSSSAKGKSLASSICSIIESQKSRDEERLDVNFDALLNEHSRLARDKRDIKILKNCKPLWEEAVAVAESLKSTTVKFESVLNIQYSVYLEMSKSLDERIKISKRDLDDAVDAEEKIKAEYEKTTNSLNSSKGFLASTTEDIKSFEARIEQAESIFAHYESSNSDIVYERIREAIAEKSASIDTLSSINDARLELQKIIRSINTSEKELASLEDTLSKYESSSLSSIDEDHAALLWTLNKDFGSLSGSFSDEARRIIEAFAELFFVDESHLSIDKKSFSSLKLKEYSLEDMRASIEESADDLRTKINKLSSEKSKLEKFVTGTAEAQGIQLGELKKSRNTLEQQKAIVSGYGSTVSDLGAKKARLAQYQARVEELREVEKTQQKSWQDAFDKKGQSERYFKLVSEEERILKGWNSSMKGILYNYEEVARVLPLAESYQPIDEKSFVEIDSLNNKRSAENAQLNSLIARLQSEMPLGETEDARFKVNRSVDELKNIMGNFANVFMSIESRENLYLNEVAAHVKYVYSFIEELKDAKAIVLNAIGDINKDLNSTRISNIEEIKLEVRFNAQFEGLLKTSEHYRKNSINEDNLFPVEFYEEMSEFANKFFDTNKKILKLHMIVEDIEYRYRLTGETSFATESQSGGTTAAISASIISVLLPRITPNYVKLCLPVIIDEIGTLDSDNQKATIEHVTSNNFTAFCATPDYSASLIKSVGRHIEIDSFTVSSPMVQKCNALILPKFIEVLGETA